MACILIVEDDADTREALKDALADEGFDVRASSGAREAIAEVTRPDAPGLVLLDATMPGMSGAELLDWIGERKQLDRIPVVLVSADTTCAGHERAVAFLQKPYALADLQRVAHRFCDSEEAEPAQKS